MRDVTRLIDANANRAREALRVMEDGARFLLDDAPLSASIKSIRHDLGAAMRAFAPDCVLSRDTPGDVGTAISTPAEMERTNPREVLIAAGKRLSEALRSLEEYAKVADPAAASRFEQLRYRGYEAERALHAAIGTGRARQWALCVLITESLCRLPWLDVARRSIVGGADCIQLREKSLPDGALLSRAKMLVELCRPQGVDVVINDRVDIALAAGADGVHLGQEDMPVREARRIAGWRLLIGVSTANIEQARRALRDGADYCGVGPMFPTTTKHKETIAGPAYLREYLAHEPALPPHLAIGGITPGNVGELVAAGVKGIAVSSCVCGSEEPERVCGVLREPLAQAGGHAGASPCARIRSRT